MTTAAIAGIATAARGTGSESKPAVATTQAATTKSSQGSGLQQQISVVVVGGKMTITPSNITLTLTPDGNGGRYTAALPTIRVVDARGSLAGWTATITPTDLAAAATFRIKPANAVAIYGNQSEIRTAQPSNATREHPATLMSADPDGGGGTFEVGGAVVVTLPHGHASQTTLHVTLTVA